MTYTAFFSLDSVKVIRSDGEDGEYTFRLYYQNTLYSIVNTPEDVEDGSEHRPNAVAFQIGPFNDDERFVLKLESTEYDGGFRLGDGHASLEKSFGKDDNGLHRIYMKDDDENEMEFRINITIQLQSPSFGGQQLPPLNTESGLLGAMLYEDWNYNQDANNTSFNSFQKPRSQRFPVGQKPAAEAKAKGLAGFQFKS